MGYRAADRRFGGRRGEKSVQRARLRVHGTAVLGIVPLSPERHGAPRSLTSQAAPRALPFAAVHGCSASNAVAVSGMASRMWNFVA